MTQRIPQYLRDHAEQLEKKAIFLADNTMRYGSTEGLTLLALRATGGRCDYAQLLAEAREIVSRGSAAGLPAIDLPTLAYVARVMGSRPAPGPDYTEAADLCQAVRILLGGKTFAPGKGPGDTDRLNAQVNIASGRFSYVEEVLPSLTIADETRWMLDTELLNPTHRRPGSDDINWLRRFNWIFVQAGVAPIALEEGEGTPFERVIPAATPTVVTDPGPTVSVVMSVFKPDQSLFTALRSLRDQTWPHLQVLVVDDCSPEEYQPMIEEAVALDDRFELHRMPKNGGTYKIRNYAISVSRGEFIAFQDSDDWSHPERIERQLRPLLEDPRRVATLSRSVRVYSNLSANKIGYAPLRRNVSSLLLRRDTVLSEVGGFDEVRKSADSEFLERMELHFGAERVVTLDEPLALVQLTTGSLSRTDFQFGWRDGNRVAYRQAFEFWHKQIALGKESVHLQPGAARRFPAPRAMLGVVKEPRECNFLIVSDWRDGLGRSAGAADEISALAGAGLSTEMLHAETMRFAMRRRVSPSDEVMTLQSEGVSTFAQWDDSLTAAVAVVRDPELLCYPRRSDLNSVQADRVLLVARYPPRSPENGAIVYDPVTVEARAATLFKGAVAWLPATHEIAEALRADGSSAQVAPPRLVGVVAQRRRSHPGFRASRPIVGTTGLEGGRTRDTPDVDQLISMLPDDDAYDVRIRDPLRALTLKRKAKDLPPNWLLCWDTPLEEFVDQLDLFVGIQRNTWGPELIHEAAVAAARGCVLVLPPSYEQHFGHVAIYAEPEDVRAVIDRLWRDEAMFADHQKRGHAWAERNLSADAFRVILAGHLNDETR